MTDFEVKAAEIVALHFGKFDAVLEASIASALSEAVAAERDECRERHKRMERQISKALLAKGLFLGVDPDSNYSVSPIPSEDIS